MDVRDIKLLNLDNKFAWTITNFSKTTEKVGEKCYSPSLTHVEANAEYNVYLEIYPNGETASEEDYIAVYLYIDPKTAQKIMASYTISLQNKNGEEIIGAEGTRTFGRDTGWGSNTFTKRSKVMDEAEGLLVDDKLIVLCRFSLLIFEKNKHSPLRENLRKIQENFKHCFENKKFCDVTLIVRGQEFPAHKVILACRSPVFSAMFTHDMKEKRENKVEISDMEPEVLQEVLRFIYCGYVNNAQRLAPELLVVADKYQLDGLADLCAIELGQDINVENAAQLYSLAGLHSLDGLKNDTLEFMVDHANDVKDTEGLRDLCSTANQPNLVQAYISALASKIEEIE